MHIIAVLFGCVFLAGVLLDAFQTIILPRRPVGRFRITRAFFLVTWGPWKFLAGHWPVKRHREQMYSFYGPLSLLLLFGVWAVLMVAAYALIYFGMHVPFNDPTHPVTVPGRLLSCFYVSGTTLFTLGLGDVLPASRAVRMLIVAEAGTGLGFVALVIGYLPVLYMAFSTREVAVAMLDARAGSPPAAGELLFRHNFDGGHQALTALLAEWERWCAEMLETHISYPILCYYRSQHDNQSWLAALTAVLDTCALLITTIDTANDGSTCARQAQLTFAIGRHTLVDLGHVFHLERAEQRLRREASTRLGDEEFARLCNLLAKAGFSLCGDVAARERLAAIRVLYEPHACALAEYLRLGLPTWAPPPVDPLRKRDGWSTVADLRSPNAIVSRLVTHVSAQSTARHLEERD
jgi:Ion channel